MRLMGKSRVRFFRSTTGVNIALGLREGKNGWYTSTILTKNSSGEYIYASRCKYFVDKNSVYITNGVSKLRGKNMGFFRFYLNHAIAIAKKEGISKITLEAENEKLKEYYSKFGFKFMGLNGERKI